MLRAHDITRLSRRTVAGSSPVAPVYEARAKSELHSPLVVIAGSKTARWKRFWKRWQSQSDRPTPPWLVLKAYAAGISAMALAALGGNPLRGGRL